MTFENSKQLAEVAIIYKSIAKPSEFPKITNSNEAYQILKNIYNPDTIEHHEEFIILLLNRANKVMSWSKTSQGGTSGTVVDIKHILQLAIKTNACGIVLSHNHPSGGLVPSEQDKTITRKIKEAAKLFDITLLDHVIMTSEYYYSFSDEGIM